MPSTYTTNNGIELIGDGEQSGTWGDTTNTNLTLIDTSLDGHATITLVSAGTSGSPNTLPITDGAASNGRNRALIITDGGDLGADVYAQLTPNDAKKILFVRNSLSGSRNLILFQGTYNASNDFVLAAGKDAIVKFDGAGTGAVASALLSDLALDAATLGSATINGNITVTGTVDGRDIAADGTKLDTVETNADVTDTANVTAAGALMDSELTDIAAVKALDQGVATTDSPSFAGLTATTADINGGTIDGTVIGGTTPAAGSFTTLSSSGLASLDQVTLGVSAITADDANVTTPGFYKTADLSTATNWPSWMTAGPGSLFVVQGTNGNNLTQVAFSQNGSDTAIRHYRASSWNSWVRFAMQDENVSFDDVTIADKIIHSGDTNTSIRFPSADTFTVETAGSEAMRIDSSGNVGIGTSSPTAKLTVDPENDGGAGIFIDNPSSGTASNWGLEIDSYSKSNQSDLVFNGNAVVGSQNSLNFVAETGGVFTWNVGGTSHKTGDAGSSEAMRITSSGNVGIGTSSPTEELHISAAIPTIRLEDSDGTNQYTDFKVAGGVAQIIARNNTSHGTLQIRRFNGTDNLAVMTTNAAGDVLFYNDDGTTIGAFWDASAERLGIGTSSPSAKLEVNSGTGTNVNSAALILRGEANPHQTNMFIYGVRQANPNADVGSIAFFNDENVDGTYTEVSRIVASGDGDIKFHQGASGGSEVMRINGNGDVGIGTSSPSEKLSVTGNVTISGSLSKGSGSFKIDHPVKPDTHHLVHSFIEGPQADNLYRGKAALVDGKATVNLDEAGRMTEGTFVALNGNVQCFTANESGWTAVRGSVTGNILTIEAQDATCTDTVSWLVIGERHDQHMLDTDWTDENGRIITEPEKANHTETETE